MSKKISFLFLFLIQFAVAKTIIVGEKQKFKTIKSALTVAENGDIIKIKKGIYREHNIIVEKEIKIIGEIGTVVDGEKKGEIFSIQADNVTIKYLTIRRVGISTIKDWAAIRVSNSKNFTIEHNTLKDMFFGIYLAKSSEGIIKNNTIEGIAKDEYNSGNGIHLWYVQNVEIIGNHISGSRDGIYFEFADHCLIKKNYSTRNLRYGLHFMFSNHDEYIDNKFINNGAGVAVMFSKFINMYNNEFKQNWGTSAYGLLLKEIYDAEIEGNNFQENTIGIQIEGTTRINYLKNNFYKNGWALKINGAAYTNAFKYNNFISNSLDLAYNSNVNDNVFTENYWSEYSGYDLNKDGYGDVPYRPVKLFAYIIDKTPEAIVLLRSLFIDIINFSEKVSPVFTPDNLLDHQPKMKPYDYQY